MNRVTPCLVLCAAAALAGCASQPAATSPPQAASAVPASSVRAIPNTAAAQSDDKFKAPYGYRRVVASDGHEIFCKSETLPGSRTEKSEVCFTRAELESRQERTQQYIQELQRNSSIGGGMGNVPGGGGPY